MRLRDASQIAKAKSPFSWEAILTELVIEMENDFGVSDSAEYPTLPLQGIAKLDIVEDLAVDDNRKTTSRERHRLLTVAQLNDRQTSVAQSNAWLQELALLIRHTMDH
jgi:hypothetical protein